MKNLIPAFKLLKDVFFDTTVTSIINTSNIKVKAQKLKHIEFPNKSDYINLVYSIDDAWLLQSGYGEVLEENSNDPNYGIF